MENLFDKKTSEKFIERINKLTPQTPAQWGKMNVAQMLTHCQAPFQIAAGNIVPKVNPLIKLLFGKRAKKQMISGLPIPKNLPTFSEAKIVDERIFDNEKKKLIAAVEHFQSKGAEGIKLTDHPFFGLMSTSDWNALEINHLDHHLRQFGV